MAKKYSDAGITEEEFAAAPIKHQGTCGNNGDILTITKIHRNEHGLITGFTCTGVTENNGAIKDNDMFRFLENVPENNGLKKVILPMYMIASLYFDREGKLHDRRFEEDKIVDNDLFYKCSNVCDAIEGEITFFLGDIKIQDFDAEFDTKNELIGRETTIPIREGMKLQFLPDYKSVIGEYH